MEGHNELIPLELPHLVGNRLDFKESVAANKRARKREQAPRCSLVDNRVI